MGARIGQIKQTIYQLEDLLDDLDDLCSVARHASGRIWETMLFWLSGPFILHATMASRLDTINGKLKWEYLFLYFGFFSGRQHIDPNREQHNARLKLDGASIIGRESEKEYIKDLLLQNNTDKLLILPIVGLPGLGKTTLARLFFEDKGQEWDFDHRVWINMSEGFDRKKIASAVILEANKSAVNGILQVSISDKALDDYELIKHSVQEILHRSSYLIVLHNLLRVNNCQLDSLMGMLGTKQKSTAVIITTSSEKVAELMQTVPSCNLGILSEDDCWAIFAERAFGKGDVKADLQYIEIGKGIVKRCEGNPMLAQSLGSMVHNQGINTWLSAKDDELWKLEERLPTEAKVFTSFKEMYYSLPEDLKSCFLYLAVFPKGSNIEKAELIRQWAALDMLRSSLGSIPTSLLGDMYIEHLLSISFLQVVDVPLANEMKYSSTVFLRMHNLVYDFLRYVAKDDVVILDHRKTLIDCVENHPCRYAVFTNYSGQSAVLKGSVASAKAVFFKSCEGTKYIADALSELTYSCLLDLSGCPFEELPASVNHLKHLRYLNISNSQIRVLPIGVSSLQKLEYLDISKTDIKILPSFIGAFEKLKYFNLHGCNKLCSLPPTIGGLKRLGNLNLACCSGISELPASLCGLHELRLLDLSGCTKLERLPHQFGNLKQLEDLNLAGCSRLNQLPESFGELSCLRSLNLAGCSNLEGLQESIVQAIRKRLKS